MNAVFLPPAIATGWRGIRMFILVLYADRRADERGRMPDYSIIKMTTVCILINTSVLLFVVAFK
jgi:hypothetical protein